jgi:hypothetical protein
MHLSAICCKYHYLIGLIVANMNPAPNVRAPRLRVGKYVVGVPQLTLRAHSDLVVLQGQGFEVEVTVRKVRAAYYAHVY